VLLISAFFPSYQGLILISIYLIGIIIAVLVALALKRFMFAREDVPFVMELPPYRIPTLRNTSIHMWFKGVQYLQKMGSVILVASIIIWALGYFPQNVEYSINYEEKINNIEQSITLSEDLKSDTITKLKYAKAAEQQEKSFIGQMGHFITPVLEPLGFDWKIGVSIITGMAAKEIVVSTMGVLYQTGADEEGAVSLQKKLQDQTHNRGELKGQKVFTPLVAYSFMLFVLIYFPCVAVIAAIKKEAYWKCATFTMIYTTGVAWLVAFLTYQIGSLL